MSTQSVSFLPERPCCKFMTKNLIFDFGGVLICYDFPSIVKPLFADDAERRAFEEVVCSDTFMDRCDLGEEPFAEIIRKHQELYPQWKRQLQEFQDRQLDAMTGEMPGMRDLLARLKADGYHIYGLTNWSETIYPVIEKFDILQMMDGTLISSEEKLLKPDAAIYCRLCEKFGLRPQECLFTDDKQVNVDGALAVGMQAVLFTNAAEYEKDINSIVRLSREHL